MKAVTLGEIMLRLTPFGHKQLVQAETLEADYGGAEANVAVALAVWGEEASFVSKVPANGVGQAAVNALRRYGVDTRHILRGGERLGLYYAERGADRRAGSVVYDRAGSAFSQSVPEEYDWDAIFTGADRFHITGITPALGEGCARLAETACRKAKEHGAAVSCDVNYRSKLWGKERAAKVLERLFRYVDVCIVNENHAKELFGCTDERTLAERYGFTHVAFTYRRTKDARHNKIWAELYAGGEKVQSRAYEMEMVDRIGGGDAFAAGLVYALGHGYPLQNAVDFAEAASCLKHSVEGDQCLIGSEEIAALAAGGGSAQVRR